MGEINKALGNAGTPLILEVGGRTWKFSPLSIKRVGALEEWAESRVMAKAQERKATLDREDYLALLSSINEACAAKEYAYNSEFTQRLLRKTFEGQVQFVLALLRPNHPDVTTEDVEVLLVDHADELNAAVERLIGKAEASADRDPPVAGTRSPA